MPETPNQPGQIIDPQDDSAEPKASPEALQPELPAPQPELVTQSPPTTVQDAIPPEPTPVPADNDQAAPFTANADVSESVFPGQQGDHQDDWQLQPTFSGNNSEHPSEYSWGALEFVAHTKSTGWYLSLTIGTAVLAAITFLLTKDKISTSIVVIAGFAFGIYAARKPNQIQYALDRIGLTIRDKHVAYNYFRSFSVADEGALVGVSLFPLKRFGQLTTIYLDPKDEETIIAILASHLPLEQHPRDYIDDFMRRIHF